MKVLKFWWWSPFLFASVEMFGQQDRMDSLQGILPSVSVEHRMIINLELARSAGESDFQALDDYASEALTIALALSDTFHIVQAKRLKAQAYRRMSKFDSSIMVFKSLIPIVRKKRYNSELAKILNGLGVAHIMLAHYDEAYKYLVDFLELSEKERDRPNMVVAFINIGLIYYKMSDFQTALSYYSKAFEINSELNDVARSVDLLASMSLCHAYLGDANSARTSLRNAERLCNGSCNVEYTLQASFSSGICEFIEGKYEEAKEKFLQGLSFAKKLGDDRMQLDNFIYLARTQKQLSRYDSTLYYLKMAENLVGNRHAYSYELLEVYGDLSSLYLGLKQFQLAVQYQQKAMSLKDTVYNGKVTTNLMRAQAEYIEKTHQLRAESQMQVLELKEEVIRRQRYINIFVCIISILLLLLLWSVLRRLKRKQRMNQLLDRLVRQRTIELIDRGNELQRTSNEKDVTLTRLAVGVNGALATIKGLCQLARKDKSEVDQYIDAVQVTSEKIASILNDIVSKKIEKASSDV